MVNNFTSKFIDVLSFEGILADLRISLQLCNIELTFSMLLG